MRRHLVRFLAVVAIGAALASVGGARPAYACDCAAGSPEEHERGADVVVVGRITAGEQVDVGERFASKRLTVEVTRVHKGDLPARAVLGSPLGAGACELELPLGQPVLLYASSTSRFPDFVSPKVAPYGVSSCGGSRLVEPEGVPAGLGAGRAPSGEAALVPTTTAARASGTVEPDGSEPPIASPTAAAVGAGALAAAVGAAMFGRQRLARRRRERSDSPPR